MSAPDLISIHALRRLVGTPASPVIVDVRTPEDFADDPRMIPGSLLVGHGDAPSMALPAGRKVVIVCQKGLKISQGVAALLRARGVAAEALEGGQFGWRDAGAPMIDTHALPALEAGGTRWVTRSRPKIDRLGCCWLVRRFIDPDATFLFVERSQVEPVAERFGATAFDIAASAWGDREGRCSFDAFLANLSLHDPALDVMAEILRAADLGAAETVREAPGWLAVMLGLSRLERDANRQLDQAMAMHDALYRWARDARDETHGHA